MGVPSRGLSSRVCSIPCGTAYLLVHRSIEFEQLQIQIRMLTYLLCILAHCASAYKKRRRPLSVVHGGEPYAAIPEWQIRIAFCHQTPANPATITSNVPSFPPLRHQREAHLRWPVPQ